MKRFWLRAGAAALAAVLLTGCAQYATLPSSQKHKVALVAKSTNTQFWKDVFAGAQAAATEYNLELTISGPATEEDYVAQNQLVAQAVEDGAEALVFSAISHENNAPAIDEAARNGVEIVAIDSSVDSDAAATYIGTNNYAAGTQAARAALDSGLRHLYVGLVNYDVASANGQEREQGVRDALGGADHVTIVDAINVLADSENARAGTAQMLARNPEINVLIAFNEPTSVGAALAVQEGGLDQRVFLVGFDSNLTTIDLLQTGAVDALIVQNTYAIGYLGVESAYRLLAGQRHQLQPVVDTATVTVTAENMFTVDIQKNLFAFQSDEM